jgi:hypothetical protein
MSQIHKFSLAYDAEEDRLAWDAEDILGGTTRLWLTQRLCRGLVGALLPMLEQAAPQAAAPGRQAVVQAWEQAAAMAEFGKTPGVRPRAETVAGLVRAAHIRPSPASLELTFEFGDGQSRVVAVAHAGVRQMLAVMRRLYVAAGWPLDIWPAWMAEPPAGRAPSGAVN